jgi:hypothetical protein
VVGFVWEIEAINPAEAVERLRPSTKYL